MARYLPLILKNCWRNRRRTVLTVLSISVSMCLLGVMIAIYHAFYLSSPAPEFGAPEPPLGIDEVTRPKAETTIAQGNAPAESPPRAPEP